MQQKQNSNTDFSVIHQPVKLQILASKNEQKFIPTQYKMCFKTLRFFLASKWTKKQTTQCTCQPWHSIMVLHVITTNFLCSIQFSPKYKQLHNTGNREFLTIQLSNSQTSSNFILFIFLFWVPFFFWTKQLPVSFRHSKTQTCYHSLELS